MGATKKTVGTYFWTSNFLPQHPRALRTNFLDSGTMYSITYCMGNLFMVFKSRASTQEIISSITKTGCLCETVVVLEMISWGSALGIYNRTPNNSLIAGLVSTRHKIVLNAYIRTSTGTYVQGGSVVIVMHWLGRRRRSSDDGIFIFDFFWVLIISGHTTVLEACGAGADETKVSSLHIQWWKGTYKTETNEFGPNYNTDWIVLLDDHERTAG